MSSYGQLTRGKSGMGCLPFPTGGGVASAYGKNHIVLILM